MYKFPFISLSQSVIVLRIVVALVFIVHATVRLAGGTIPRFANFLNDKGLVIGLPLVWLITIFETGGGLLLLAGVLTRWLALLFILLIAIGIVLIHAANGWFVGEHGTGGMEYSIVLIFALLVIAASDKNR